MNLQAFRCRPAKYEFTGIEVKLRIERGTNYDRSRVHKLNVHDRLCLQQETFIR